jgi:hypothetical protein
VRQRNISRSTEDEFDRVRYSNDDTCFQPCGALPLFGNVCDVYGVESSFFIVRNLCCFPVLATGDVTADTQTHTVKHTCMCECV